MTHADKITKKLEQMNFKSTVAMREKILSEASQAMEKTINAPANKPSVRRIIMKSRITKFAAAVIIIALLTGIYQITGSIDGASVAFAQVLDNIQHCNYTFDVTIEPISEASSQDLDPPIKAQAMVIQPQKLRLNWLDSSVGDVSVIVDYTKKQYIQLLHKSKIGKIKNYDGNIKGDLSFLFYKPVEKLWDLKDGSERILGEKQLFGHTATGFEVVQGSYKFTIWANSKNGLPLYVEAISETDNPLISVKWDMGNFNFNSEPDKRLFTLGGPSEYTIVDGAGVVVKAGREADGNELTNETETISENVSLFLIKPLQGVGDVKFGMTRKQIVEILGEPDQIIGKHCLDYTSTIGLSLLVSSKRGLVAIDCWSQQEKSNEGLIGGRDFSGKTDKDIGINSTRGAIISHYGKPQEEYLSRHNTFELSYPQLNTIFGLKNNKVVHISMHTSR